MSEASDPRPGHFFWHDLSTDEPHEAIDFYGAVLGWKATPFGGDGPAYWTWEVDDAADGERGRGGLFQLTDAARDDCVQPGWMGYVLTLDTDRDAGRAEELGGSVALPPHTLPGVGRMAVIRDPEGACLTLMTPATSDMPEGGAGGWPTAGARFDWHELAAGDLDAAFDFYAELFGWQLMQSHDMGAMGSYRIFGSHGVQLGGMFALPEVASGERSWMYYVRVDDLDDALRRLEQAGGSVHHGPSEVPEGRIAQCTDPQGTWIGLHEMEEGR